MGYAPVKINQRDSAGAYCTDQSIAYADDLLLDVPGASTLLPRYCSAKDCTRMNLLVRDHSSSRRNAPRVNTTIV